MNVREVGQSLGIRPVGLDRAQQRLTRCLDIHDMRACARRVAPRPVFDYVDGGCDEELGMAANRAALTRWRLLPRALVDVSVVDTAAKVLGQLLPVPLILGPTGFTRLVHPVGEPGVARAAARHGLPYTLSTLSNTSIEDLAAASGADRWFQLYLMQDSGLNAELVGRAAAAGYRVLVVTVDAPVAGHRTRDRHNGLVIPPRLSLRSVASIAARPAYWLRLLSSPAIVSANLVSRAGPMPADGALPPFSPATSWDDIAALRDRWSGKLVVKGPLGAADARRAMQAGADAVQLSNHGGRQFDRTVPPADLIPEVRDAVGTDFCVLVDSGIRHGTDIATCIALGADAGVIGRAYLYGLMAGGERGVDQVLDVLASQFRRTLQLLGITSTADLREHGRQMLRLAPGAAGPERGWG